MKKIFWLLTAMLYIPILWAQVVTDPYFGKTGAVITDFGQTSRVWVNEISGPDNSLILNIDGKEWYKLQSDGSPDFSFGDNGKVRFRNPAPEITAVRNDGKLYTIKSDNEHPEISCILSRYHQNGSIDTRFGHLGSVTIFNTIVDSAFSWDNEYFRTSHIAPFDDGRIMVAGTLTGPVTWGGTQIKGIRIYVFSKFGHPDPLFGTNGVYELRPENLQKLGGATTMKDGNILFSYFGWTEGQSNYNVYKLDGNGNPVNSFGNGGKVTIFSPFNANVNHITMLEDGRICSFGSSIADHFGGYYKQTIITIQKPDGSFDTSFNGTGLLEIPGFYTISFMKDQNGIYLAGYKSFEESPVQTSDFEIAFLDFKNANLITKVKYDKLFPYPPEEFHISQFIKTNDRFFAIGRRFESSFLLAYDKNLKPDQSFAGEGFRYWNTGFSYARGMFSDVLTNGNIVIGGMVNPEWDFNQTNYLSTVTLSPEGNENVKTTNRNIYLLENAPVLRDAGRYLFGAGTRTGGPGIVRTDKYGQPDHSFGIRGWVSLPPNTRIMNIGKTNDGKYILAGVKDEYPSREIILCRLYPDGAFDISHGNNGIVSTTFPMENWYIRQMILHDDGSLTVMGLNTFMQITRYNPDGTRTKNFGVNGVIIGPAVYPYENNRIFILSDGNMMVITLNENTLTLHKYDSKGKPSTEPEYIEPVRIQWDENVNLTSIVQQPDGKIIFGGYTPGSNSFKMLRINTDGKTDHDFGPDGKVDTPMDYPVVTTDLFLQNDGKIMQTGYVSYDDGSDVAVVRYLNDLQVGTVEGYEPKNIINVYPNPVSSRATLVYELSKDENTTITLANYQGVVVRTFGSETKAIAGRHTVGIDVSDLPDGMYILSVTTLAGSRSVRIVVMNKTE